MSQHCFEAKNAKRNSVVSGVSQMFPCRLYIHVFESTVEIPMQNRRSKSFSAVGWELLLTWAYGWIIGSRHEGITTADSGLNMLP